MGLQSITKRLKQINFGKTTTSKSTSSNKKGVLSKMITWDSVDSYKVKLRITKIKKLIRLILIILMNP